MSINNTLGSSKQEKKIAEMSSLAQKSFPDLQLLTLKGAFRLAVKDALKVNKYSTWGEVAKKDAAVRQKFFQSIVEHSGKHLEKLKIAKEDVSKFQDDLREMNKKYLS